MIPEERLSSETLRGDLRNPWTRDDLVSQHWGPIAIQDPTQGLGVKIWQARVEQDGDEILFSTDDDPEFVWYTHTDPIVEVSLAFDPNARPVVAIVDKAGGVFLRWFDPVPNDVVNFDLTGIATGPRVTYDDDRPFNVNSSDVILGYSNAGVLCYRQLRDRFTIERVLTFNGDPVAADGVKHISMNSKLRLEWFITGEGGGDEEWLVPDVVSYIARRANLPGELLNLSQMDWEQVVRGYLITNEYPCFSAISSLSQVFFFDPASADGRVHFIPRGRDVATRIVERDLLESPDDRQKDTRHDTIEIPRILHLQYYDEVAGLNPSIQHAERVEGVRAQGEATIATTITMTSDEAASVVARQHAIIVEQQRGIIEFSLSDRHVALTESDVIEIEIDGVMTRCMITHVELEDGEQRYKAVRDRRAAYSLEVEGVQQPAPTPPPSSYAGPTHIEILDMPLMRDLDDRVGLYVAVGGEVGTWPGAVVEMSIDGGANYESVDAEFPDALIGELSAPLGSHPHWYPDRQNTISVSLLNEFEHLSGAPFSSMLNRWGRINVGDERIIYGDVNETAPGEWELSFLLRGRAGTVAQAHAPGERFVLLSDAVFIPLDQSLIGLPLTFRATSLGRPLDESVVVTHTFQCVVQQERAPAYLKARRSGSSLIVSWQGVGRVGGGAHVSMGLYFWMYRITVSDGTTEGVFELTANTLTIDISGYSGPITVRAQQRNQITGLGPATEVIV